MVKKQRMDNLPVVHENIKSRSMVRCMANGEKSQMGSCPLDDVKIRTQPGGPYFAKRWIAIRQTSNSPLFAFWERNALSGGRGEWT
jgi:hypothetical protein